MLASKFPLNKSTETPATPFATPIPMLASAPIVALLKKKKKIFFINLKKQTLFYLKNLDFKLI
jgi:hypothetical protein